MTKQEVIEQVARDSNEKVGVREKVSEVVDRMCTVNELGTLKW